MKKAKDDYERIVLIRTIGNAGMPNTLSKLKEIAQSQKESSLIRINAIEAMRYLVWDSRTGFKVRNALLPIFTNINEVKNVRLAAVQQLLQHSTDIQGETATTQAQSFVDQIVYVIKNENSEEVVQFVYSLLQSKTTSPLEWERNL